MDKCQFFDKGYCKHKDKCNQLHPLQDCSRNCEDRRACTKRHRIPCRNGDICEWKSCNFLHISQKDSLEVSEIHTLKINLKQQENDFRAQTKAHKEIVNELTNKVQTAEHKLQDMTDRVEAIEEEYSARLEEHENALKKLANLPKVDTFKKLEDKIKVLKEQSNNIIDKLSDMTSKIITNGYANDEFMDTKVEEIKKGNCNVCK